MYPEVSSNKIRKRILELSNMTEMSHVGTSLSSVEILNSLYKNSDIELIKKNQSNRNRIILSKGHGVMALYACLEAYGILKKEQISSINRDGSLFGGHPPIRVKGIEHATGALGHGASVGVGMAYGMKLKGILAKVYIVIGDGELHEGSNWEAFMQAASMKLDNIYFLIDKNDLSGIEKTSCCDLGFLEDKMKAFGLQTSVVCGHNENEIISALNRPTKMPNCIICNTVKGKGVSFMENDNVWHYRPLLDKDYSLAIKEVVSNNAK